MGPVLAGMAGMAGAKLLGSALDSDDAQKRAMMQLHQQYASGNYGAPVAPQQQSNLAADLGQGAMSVGLGALASDDKDKEIPWYKAAARGALGKGV